VTRVVRLLRELALTGGAVVGTLCLLVAVLGATADVRTLVFTSGSMAPAIRTGDLAVTRPVELAHLSPGDVVSVLDARGARVTHRVVGIDTGRHLLVLKGDANAVADALPYPVDRADRVLFSVPAGGYVLTWLSSPPATLLLGAYLMFLLSVLWPRGRTADRPRRPDTGRPDLGRHRAGSTAAGLLLVVVGLAAAGAPRPEPTLAAFTDAVPVAGTSLTAYTVPKPVITDCSAALLNVTVTWTAVSTPYPLTYRAVVVETGQSLQVTGTGGTRSARYTTLGQGSSSATQTIRITATPPSAPSWVSAPANQVVRPAVLGAVPSCGASS
jgi:signal peptidase I